MANNIIRKKSKVESISGKDGLSQKIINYLCQNTDLNTDEINVIKLSKVKRWIEEKMILIMQTSDPTDSEYLQKINLLAINMPIKRIKQVKQKEVKNWKYQMKAILI